MADTLNKDFVLSKEAILVRDALIAHGLETPYHGNGLTSEQKKEIIAQKMTEIMTTLGLDLSDDSLEKTPKRVAKMFVDEIYSGLDYRNFPEMCVLENKMHVDEMIKVCDITLTSTCEHHFVVIDGIAKVAYMPSDRIIGLSKINRIVQFFGQRPQVQERLTQQIKVALQTLLNTKNVAVTITATHYCVKARGVKDQTSTTTTTALGGLFKTNPSSRHEFLTDQLVGTMRKTDYKVALIVPVYNEHETVETFVQTVNEKLEKELEHIEIVFIDDGSKDNTVELITKMQETDNKISLIKLSRNFGKEAAMSAALDLVTADAIVPIDVDLQDPPELVHDFIRIWRDEGIDNVYGVREDRSKDTNTKRVSSEGFYYVFNSLSSKVKIPSNVGDFRLIDRKIIDILKTLKERNRFMKALYAWPGFSSKGVGYSRPERVAGTTKWNYWKLWNFALDGIFAFSSLPLRVWSYIGCGIGFISFIYMMWNLIKTMIFGNPTAGYTTLICVILFLGAFQLISIGVLGEYIGRLSQEVKGRPVYVAQSITGPLSHDIKQGLSQSVVGIAYNENSKEASAKVEEVVEAPKKTTARKTTKTTKV